MVVDASTVFCFSDSGDLVEVEGKIISVVAGIVCFFIGLKLLNWSNHNSTGDELKETFQPDIVSGYGEDYRSHSYMALALGFVLLCAGSIMVGGVLFGWDTEHIIDELYNTCGSMVDWIL